MSQMADNSTVANATGSLLPVQVVASLKTCLQKTDEDIKHRTLYLLDIDGVLMESKHAPCYMFSEEGVYAFRTVLTTASNVEQANKLCSRFGDALYELKTVEVDTLETLHRMQREGYVCGLTSRYQAQKNGTEEQLDSLGIDFTRADPLAECTDGGIIYTSSQAKSSALKPLLVKILRKDPLVQWTVVFVDDRKSNVDDVNACLDKVRSEEKNLHSAHCYHFCPHPTRGDITSSTDKQLKDNVLRTQFSAFVYRSSILSDIEAQLPDRIVTSQADADAKYSK